MAFKDFTITEGTSADLNTYLMPQMLITCTSGTRPSSPTIGMHIWETDTLREMSWDGSTWVLLGATELYVRKTVNETVNNSSTVQADDELFLALAINAVYLFSCMVRVDSADAGSPDTTDVKLQFTGPTGATGFWSPQAPHSSSTDTIFSSNISINKFNLGGSADAMTTGGFVVGYLIRGIIIMGSTAGNLTLNWAQTTAHSLNTRMLFDSFLRAERVA